jgi:hypothetical protein
VCEKQRYGRVAEHNLVGDKRHHKARAYLGNAQNASLRIARPRSATPVATVLYYGLMPLWVTQQCIVIAQASRNPMYVLV